MQIYAANLVKYQYVGVNVQQRSLLHGMLYLHNNIITSAKKDYVIVVVCLSICLLATLRKNFRTDLHEIFTEGWQWANEQTIKFW